MNTTEFYFKWLVTPQGIFKVQVLSENETTYIISLPEPTFEQLTVPKTNVFDDFTKAADTFNKLGGNS